MIMDTLVFADKQLMPDMFALQTALGNSYKILSDLFGFIEVHFGATVPEWKFYSAKYGWTLKTMLKKRNLFFLSPRKGFFRIAFTFGDKAIDEIMESPLSEGIKNELLNARKYAEGRGILIEVRNDEILEDLKTLVSIKVRN